MTILPAQMTRPVTSGDRLTRIKRRVYLCTIALALVLPLQAFSGMAAGPVPAELPEKELTGRQDENLNDLIRLVRDERIPRTRARARLQELLAETREQYYRSGGTDAPKRDWYFPVSGYDIRAITGGKRHGYFSRGYDFYAGNRHGGHPSLDIFIRDRDRDSRDDRTGEPVAVLSMTAGVVVATEEQWEEGSILRGGRYLWVYDPGNDLLVYYAHNEKLQVKTGDRVRPGDVLAVMGRSGFNAAKRRSPTHLHLTVLRVGNGLMKPVDVYRTIKNAKITPGVINRQSRAGVPAGDRTRQAV